MAADRFRLGLPLAVLALFAALILAWWVEAQRVEPIALTPTITGEVEYCLTCHADLPVISPSHPVESFGCVICHGGERLALDADLAHSSMRGGANPSDLAVVEASCGGGDCHSGSEAAGRDHIQRVMTSVQATYAGAIASIRYTFGAQPDLQAYFGINTVTDAYSKTGIGALAAFDPANETNPSVQKFGQNCLTCHLNTALSEDEDFSHLAGCAACHTPLTPLHPPKNLANIGGTTEEDGEIHNLTTAMPYTQCNTCHNRGNYDLRMMEFVERTDQPSGRLEDYYQPIAQFTQCEYTLDCIDCHTRTEAMGDGDIHPDQSSIQYVQCKTCHGTLTELPLTKTLNNPEDLAFTLAFLNPVIDLQPGDTILVTETGEPLWNTRVLSDGSYMLIGKSTRQYFTFRPVKGTGCQQDPLAQESRYCHECHSLEH